MKPVLMLLTNLYNGEQEDIFLGQQLEKKFKIVMCHPADCAPLEGRVDAILIRNAWPTQSFLKVYEDMKARFLRKKLKVYNDLSGSGDINGKNYLIHLFNQGYPVIPSIDNVNDMKKLPKSNHFLVKPKHGGGSKGIIRLEKKELLKLEPHGYIIQPLISFEYEISFYFIDGKFQFALRDNRRSRWTMKEFIPRKSDLEFASKFVKWNTMKYGLQRIDACRKQDGSLLLMEVEDIAPYLSLLDIRRSLRNKMIKNLITSINKNCF